MAEHPRIAAAGNMKAMKEFQNSNKHKIIVSNSTLKYHAQHFVNYIVTTI